MRLHALIISALLLLATMAATSGCSHSQRRQRDSTYTAVEHPQWSRNAVIYEVNLRQYTLSGTVISFVGELPRLHDLGVDILRFDPIFPISELNRIGSRGNDYAVADHLTVNPDLGTIDDFTAMVEQVHQMGMHVIIDWVMGRTGCDHSWATAHPDWYICDSTTGHPQLAEGTTDAYSLNYANADMQEAMIEAMTQWVTKCHVDGFYCTYSASVPDTFWNTLHQRLHATEANVLLMADDADRNAYRTTIDGRRNNSLLELQDAIAATSHQRFVHDSIANITERHAPDIDSLFARLSTLYPTDTYVLNLTSSEDLNATAGPEFDRYGMLSKPMAVLSYTLPGMPQIYTGQETGFARAFRAADKDLPPQWEPRVNEYFEFYRKLNRLKHTNHALATGADSGDMVRYATTDRDVYVFSRSADGHSVLVIVNLGPGDTYLKFTDEVPSLSSSAVNLFTDVHESLPSYLPPFAYYVYVSR